MTKAVKRKTAEPAPEKTLDQRMLDVLPPPPNPYPGDHDVEFWMRQCAKAAGIEGLQWIWQPQNWPPFYGSDRRARMFHVFGAIMRELDDAQRAKAEQQAKEQAAKRRDTTLELKRARGWA